MIGRTHKFFNVSAAFVALTAAGAPLVVAGAVSGAAGVSASWPDVVEKPLHLPHRGPSHWPLVQAAVLSLPVIAAAIWLPGVLDRLVAGIGVPHTLVAHLAVSALVAARQFAVPCVAALAAIMWMGCVWHSVADAMTVDREGIKLLWPISRRGFHLAPRFLRTRVGRDSRSEKVFVVAWCTFVLSYIYVRYHEQITSIFAVVSKHV